MLISSKFMTQHGMVTLVIRGITSGVTLGDTEEVLRKRLQLGDLLTQLSGFTVEYLILLGQTRPR